MLHINTKDQRRVEVSLKKDGQVLDILTEDREYGSQVLLPMIDRLLKKTKVDYKDLMGIKVSTGPGSFTGLRVGVSVANALGYSLGIPVNGKKLEIELVY